MEFVDDCIPYRVEVLGFIVGGELERVTTSVTSGVSLVDSSQTMKGLVNISHIVDEEAEGVRLAVFLIFHVLHHSSVDEVLLVAWLFSDPSHDSLNGRRDVSCREYEVGEITDITTLIQEWCVNEMPVGLPTATLVLNGISHGSTLNEWVISLGIIECRVLL